MESFSLAIVGALVVIGLLVLRSIVHVVPEYQRLVVFRLGSFEKVAGPGLVLLLPPPLQHVAQIVDLREFVVELSGQLCATQDNVPVSINLLVYQQVVDAAASFLNIQSFRPAVVSLATKQLRSVMREIPFDQVLAERDHIGRDLAEILNDETRRWGVKITNVEVKDLAMASGIKGAA